MGSKITAVVGYNGTMKTTILGILSQTFTISKGHVMNGEKTIAAYGASEWVVEESPNFVRSGIFMLNIHSDYYQKDTYKIVRDAISIMNPNK